MAFAYFDRVKETSTTTGTGAISLGGAVSGYVSFQSVYNNGDTFYYTIQDQNGPNWEVGLGTYTSSGNLLTRSTVLASSNSGSAVNFTSGSLYCFTTVPAAQFSGATGGVTGTGNLVLATSPTVVLASASTAVTQSAADSSTKIATTAFVNSTALTLASGTTAVTQSSSDNSTKVATTAYVKSQSAIVPTAGGVGCFVLATLSGTVSLSFGGTTAASNLSVQCLANVTAGVYGSGGSGGSLSGTWVALSGMNNGGSYGLFLRTA